MKAPARSAADASGQPPPFGQGLPSYLICLHRYGDLAVAYFECLIAEAIERLA